MVKPDLGRLQINKVEVRLQKTLRPVAPRPDFVNQLRTRLAEPIAESFPGRRIERRHVFIFGFATLLSGIFILFTTSRMLIAFWGALGLARYIKLQSDRKHLSAQRASGKPQPVGG